MVQGPCCWKVYESDNFSGNYQVIYSGGSGLRQPFKLKLKAKSIKSIPDCNINQYECVDAPICTIYNKENAPDPNNPWENLIECNPILIAANETIEDETTKNDCKDKTNGVFDKCYPISPSYHVCVPSAEEKCDENDWIGKNCNGIGNIQSGKLSQFCKEGICEYGGIVIA